MKCVPSEGSRFHVRFIGERNYAARVHHQSGSGIGHGQRRRIASEPGCKNCDGAAGGTRSARKEIGWAVVGLEIFGDQPDSACIRKVREVKGGRAGQRHLDKANKLALRYGVDAKNIYNYQNYDQLKNNPEVYVIYIVLPNGMHAEYTVRGFEAGKHVLSEKPMASTAAECQQMIDAGRKANKKLMVAYRCRYEPYNLEAIRMAREQDFGPVKVIVADHGFSIGDPKQWRLNKALAGGGSLMDIGIYSLQAARYISGEEPSEITAMAYTTPGDLRFKEVEETINFQLRFPSGILANSPRVTGTQTRIAIAR